MGVRVPPTIGQQYNRLTIIDDLGTRNGKSMVRVRCVCGIAKELNLSEVRCGTIKSCGCYAAEMARNRLLTHGHASHKGRRSREWLAWRGAHGRCCNQNYKAWANYGGRGIRICDEWKKSFETFLADMGACPIGYSLDRIDNNKGYEPGNCRWATRTQQARNKRNNVPIEYNGQTKCLAEWSSITGILSDTITHRLKAGWTPERALTQKPNWTRRSEAAAKL